MSYVVICLNGLSSEEFWLWTQCTRLPMIIMWPNFGTNFCWCVCDSAMKCFPLESIFVPVIGDGRVGQLFVPFYPFFRFLHVGILFSVKMYRKSLSDQYVHPSHTKKIKEIKTNKQTKEVKMFFKRMHQLSS